ncbi:MAG: type II secretion system minor pseudopilin GspI [Chromatiales bacterium]|nr:type II secretion system minor pseudopilin GspI [Chromatiales bacterium]
MVRRHCVRGFTLLEVMVALAVLAIALAALVKGVTENGANASRLRDNSYAHWVGMNVVAEQRLLGNWQDKGEKRGDEEMGNHSWYWSAKVSETFDEDVRRLDVEVYIDEERDTSPLARLVAFLPRPPGGSKK